jgi:hypothetical protein
LEPLRSAVVEKAALLAQEGREALDETAGDHRREIVTGTGDETEFAAW